MRYGPVQLGSAALLMVLGGCYQPPNENQLLQTFESHRPAWDRLVKMALADRTFDRISAGEIPPSGMSRSRFNEYLAIFRELGVENGMNWGIPSYPGGLFVIVSSSVPIGGKGRLTGYAYLPAPPTSVEKRLPISELPFEVHGNSGHRTVFRPLSDHWYLFYDSEW
jgi:hypothetical protein